MKDTGVLIVQHGDFPFDFIEKEPEVYHRIERVMQRLSEASRELDHSPDLDPHAADMQKLAEMIRGAGYDVEPCYLDFVRPTIAEAVKALAGRGHRRIVIASTPGLMMRSSHSLIDVPAALEAIRSSEPGLELLYAKPGVPYPLIARAIGKKINAALGTGNTTGLSTPKAAHTGTAVALVAHGDVPRDFIMKNTEIMKDAWEHAAKWSASVREWPRTEDNDPNYFDTLVLKTMLLEMFWPMPLDVGFLEFARPTMDEALDRLAAAGVKRVIVAGGTGFFDRSSHTLIDIPEAIARLKVRHPEQEISYAYPDIDIVKDDLARAITYKIERALDGDTMSSMDTREIMKRINR